jgi:hypothetical protein
MKKSTRLPAIRCAALVLGLTAWSAVHGQPSALPPAPKADVPVAPVFAHPPPPTSAPPPTVLPHAAATLHEREDGLDALLDAALRDGAIDKAAGARARMELDSIRYADDRLRIRNNGQLTDAEAYRLDTRLRALDVIIRGRSGGQL